MTYRELGYDVRIYNQEYFESEWDMGRRTTFLLNHKVERPLSVDTNVWASYFNFVTGETPEFKELLNRRKKYFADREIVLVSEDGRQEFLGLWIDPEKMKDCFLAKKDKNRDVGAMVYVDLMFDESILSQEYWKMLLERPLAVKPLPKDWLLLGYDVADSARISGLTNCGYEDADSALFEKWRPRLNENGLLKTEDDALEFKEVTNKRVSEHAPFYVYRLYRASELV